MDRMPEHTADLLRWLKEVYAIKAYRPGDNLEEYFHYSGKAELVHDLWVTWQLQIEEDNEEERLLYTSVK